jgi:hypothetical protein
MDAIFGKRRRTKSKNLEALARVVDSVTDLQTKHKIDGVFVGNDARSKKRRYEQAQRAVAELGHTREDPLAESAVKEAYMGACREINAGDERNTAITDLHAALLVLEDVKDHAGDIEWSIDTMSELRFNQDCEDGAEEPVEVAIDAVRRALKIIIYSGVNNNA